MREHRGAAERAAVFLLALWATSCIGPRAPSRSASGPAPDRTAAESPEESTRLPPDSSAIKLPPPQADGRLPALAIPIRYELDFQIDPSKDTFAGTTTITLDVQTPTNALVLHGLGLTVAWARIVTDAWRGDGQAVVRTEKAHASEVVVTFPRELPRGRAVLEISYSAPFGASALGLFRLKDSERWYAFTHFEPMSARAAFPCFDEPAYKTPFDVSVTVPPGMAAFSNMPELARRSDPRGIRFRFETTPPLPTYLVALAVGDLDVVEAGAARPVPLRLLRTRGNHGDARTPLRIAAELTQVLADYLDSPYPFPKLDLVAVPPPFASAVENAGLVTFAAPSLVPEPDPPSIWQQTSRADVLAHVLAHQWLGDLVTPRWWNDIWLSEGLATFTAARAVDLWRPSLDAQRRQRSNVEGAMAADALPPALATREPVVSEQDAMRSLHGWPSRAKAATVLSMIERWIGQDALLRGLRGYLHDRAWQSASTEDFVQRLEQASGKSLAAVAKTFLDQPGIPELDVTPKCVSGRLAAVSVHQQPFEVVGEKRLAQARLWEIPFCVAGSKSPPVCSLLTHETDEISTPNVSAGCPAFLDSDPGAAGYYRIRVGPDDLRLARVAAPSLGADTLFSVVNNAWTAISQHRLPPDALLGFLPALDDQTDWSLLRLENEKLFVIDDLFVDEASEPAFRAYVAARLARHKARLVSDRPRASLFEHPADAGYRVESLQATLLWTLGWNGDADVGAAADAVAARFLEHPEEPLDPDLATTAITVSARRSTRHRWLEFLLAQVTNPSRPENRNVALSALGALRDPALVGGALDWMLSASLSTQEAAGLLRQFSSDRGTRPVVYDWIASHWYFVNDKWRGKGMWPIWAVVRYACDPGPRAKLEALFKPSSVPPEQWFGDWAPWYAELVEGATRCGALREYGAGVVASFLRGPREEKTPAAPANSAR